MGQLFGTDGIRGIPGQGPLVPATLRRLGRVAAETLLRYRHSGDSSTRSNGTAPTILIGRDSRKSGAVLGRHLAQGFLKAGCTIVDAGMLPTPALAYLVPRRKALCGVVISASHNPPEFNGVKFFDHKGFKMSPALETEIEDHLAKAADPGSTLLRLSPDPAAIEEYKDFLLSSFPAELDLSALRIVIDCANGAASRIAPAILARLGAKVFSIGDRPDGFNINRGCGALDTEWMRREVIRRGCDVGISLDGDADRAIFADSTGGLCDGDILLSMAAADLQDRGLLKRQAVVLTVMSNYGLVSFLKSRGIRVVEVPVGDRHVTQAIEEDGLSLGGEASGHIVFRRFGPTGDGLLTALQILAILVRSKRPLSWFRRRFKVLPQVLKNFRVDLRIPLEELPRTQKHIRVCQRRLQGSGRVFVRYSGTEPLIRILVEGPDAGLIRSMADDILAVFKKEIAAIQTYSDS